MNGLRESSQEIAEMFTGSARVGYSISVFPRSHAKAQGYSEACSGPVRLAIQRSWPTAGFLKSVVHNRTELSQTEGGGEK